MRYFDEPKMQSCRFCEAKKKELLFFELTFAGYKVSTFICDRCNHFIRSELATLNICTFCGNIFLSYETPMKDTIMLIPRCGICERGSQIVKT